MTSTNAGMAEISQLLYIFHLMCTGMTVLLKPTNVRFVSTNFHHILTWDPGNGTPTDAYYTVQYTGLKNKYTWYTPKECINISVRTCDLTAAFNDSMASYFVKVQALTETSKSDWSFSEAFDPVSDTQLGPPVVNISSYEKHIILHLFPPRNNMVSLSSKYGRFQYNANISKASEMENILSLWNITSKENATIVFKNLQPNTNYCTSANITAFTNLNAYAIPSELQCIVTDAAKSSEILMPVIFISSVISLVVLLLLALLHIGGFLCIHSSLPKVLLKVTGSDLRKDMVCYLPCEYSVDRISLLTAQQDTGLDKEKSNIGSQSEMDIEGDGYEQRAVLSSVSLPRETYKSMLDKASGNCDVDCPAMNNGSDICEVPLSLTKNLEEHVASEQEKSNLIDIQANFEMNACASLENSGSLEIDLNSVMLADSDMLLNETLPEVDAPDENSDILCIAHARPITTVVEHTSNSPHKQPYEFHNLLVKNSNSEKDVYNGYMYR